MIRLVGMLLSWSLVLAGCTGRHVVAERDVGRVDGARSISSNSDLQWRIEHEPGSQADQR
jgi:hypothetical protein